LAETKKAGRVASSNAERGSIFFAVLFCFRVSSGNEEKRRERNGLLVAASPRQIRINGG
jgi:hypothetical protein